MVRSIVIPHDQTRPATICELADLGAFQAAVYGSLEPLEIPALDVTVYMSEGARRQQKPLNVRANALWWSCSAVPPSTRSSSATSCWPAAASTATKRTATSPPSLSSCSSGRTAISYRPHEVATGRHGTTRLPASITRSMRPCGARCSERRWGNHPTSASSLKSQVSMYSRAFAPGEVGSCGEGAAHPDRSRRADHRALR